jgi:hypothetical protein
MTENSAAMAAEAKSLYHVKRWKEEGEELMMLAGSQILLFWLMEFYGLIDTN